MGRKFTTETRKAFNEKKREEHIARARWAKDNAGVRLRSLASDLVWFEELKGPDPSSSVASAPNVPTKTSKSGLRTEMLTLSDVSSLSLTKLRKMRGRICSHLGSNWRQKTTLSRVPGALSAAQLASLEVEIEVLNANCALLNQILIDRKDALTDPTEEELP